MDDIMRQVKRVQGLVRRGVVSRRRLALLAKLTPSTIQSITDDDWNPTAETLAILVRVADKLEGKPDPRVRSGVAASAA